MFSAPNPLNFTTLLGRYGVTKTSVTLGVRSALSAMGSFFQPFAV